VLHCISETIHVMEDQTYASPSKEDRVHWAVTKPKLSLIYIHRLTYNLWCPSFVAAMCNPQGMARMMTGHHTSVHSF